MFEFFQNKKLKQSLATFNIVRKLRILLQTLKSLEAHWSVTKQRLGIIVDAYGTNFHSRNLKKKPKPGSK